MSQDDRLCALQTTIFIVRVVVYNDNNFSSFIIQMQENPQEKADGAEHSCF